MDWEAWLGHAEPGIAMEGKLTSMLAELRGRCPTLCPAVTPAGYADRDSDTALLALCRSPEERKLLVELLATKRRAAGGRCALTSRTVAEEDLRFVAIWELDPPCGAYQLRRCMFVCADAAVLLQPEVLLERFTKAGAEVEGLGELAQLFCETNGRPDLAETPLAAKVWLQEAVNLANACGVLACSFPSWKPLGPDGEPLVKAGSVVELARRMIGERLKGSATPKSQPSVKKRKRKSAQLSEE